jgi:hypothetical protein
MGWEAKGFKEGLMEGMSSPRGDTGSGMDEYFHEADHTRVVDFDSWDFSMAGDDG